LYEKLLGRSTQSENIKIFMEYGMMIYSGFMVPVHDPAVGFCNHGNELTGSIESDKRFNQMRDYFLLRDSPPLNFDTSSLYF